ncbi:hypothetical protein OEA41_003798 [Lepraria neglecta]|uniref:Uncharacterized protein n=1 Tax=Lepraria neglecta TaxID=209136 RepID=A0AAE0DJ84_9LECA|nr:hypothetical protein OEA41_003798 [Lepraria neglecta]
MNNEAKVRRLAKSVVLGKAKVMSYKDIEEVRAKRAAKEVIKGKGKRGRKRKSAALEVGEPEPEPEAERVAFVRIQDEHSVPRSSPKVTIIVNVIIIIPKIIKAIIMIPIIFDITERPGRREHSQIGAAALDVREDADTTLLEGDISRF